MENTNQLQSGTLVNNGLQLFNTVQNRLHQLSISEIINKLLIKVEKNDDNYEIDETEYEVLGGIAYLLGLDFHSMKEPNNVVLTNVIIRLKTNNISYIDVSKFFLILENIYKKEKLGKLIEVKERLFEKIKSFVVSRDEVTIFGLIREILNNSLIPVEYVQDIQERFFDKNVLTYHDCIVFNTLVYENLITTGESADKFINLSSPSLEYTKILAQASNYFELQKFVLFYDESIFNVINKNIVLENQNNYTNYNGLFDRFLNDESLNTDILSEVKESNTSAYNKLNEQMSEFLEDNESKQQLFNTRVEDQVESDQIVEEEEVIEKNPLNHSVSTLENNFDNPLDNPTEVIKQILFDFNKLRNEENLEVLDFKNNPMDLTILVESMLNNEDIVSPFYMYIKKLVDVKSTLENSVSIDTSKIFNYDLKEFNEAYDSRLEYLKDEYNGIIGDYIKVIPNEDLIKLLPKINTILRTLHIGNSEDKSIIYSQLSENTVFTVKHLHNIINIIEKQYISGLDIVKYNEFKKYFEDEFENYVTIFNRSQELEIIELQIKLNITFQKVFN